MRRRGLLLLAALLLGGGTVRAGEETRAAEITGDRVRVRAGPSTRYAVLARLGRGDLVEVLGGEGKWRRVRLPGGYACWVHGSLVRREKDGTAVVTATRVLLRPTAGKELLPLETVLDRGEVLTVLGEKEGWVRVIAPLRAFAYVYGEYVRPLGPAREYRRELAAAAEKRRRELLASRPGEEARAIAEERARRERKKAVIAAGAEILAGRGDPAAQERVLQRAVLEDDDDLTRGYARALLGLLALRREAERLREDLAKARAAKEESVAALEKRAAEAEARYREALKTARELRRERERPWRGVGVIEKRDGTTVLVAKGRVLFRLVSKRFKLADYVGRRVGVNGRLLPVKKDGESPGPPRLLVEKIEILLLESGGR